MIRTSGSTLWGPAPRALRARRAPIVTRTLSPTRRRLLEFLASLATLHVVAIVSYYAFEVELWRARSQRAFAWSWLGATMIVIVLGLQRIKRARREGRRGSSGQLSNRS